jgi:DNA-binding CsgD family transcriptional regulator
VTTEQLANFNLGKTTEDIEVPDLPLSWSDLTSREQQAAILLSRGLSVEEMAKEMRLARPAVYYNIVKVRQKSGTSDRAALKAWTDRNTAAMGRLTSAILASRTARVGSLLQRGTPVNGADKYGTTPLYKAAVQGETEIVRMLLEAGADPDRESRGEDEGRPLCAAASWGRTDIVRLLLEHGADPNAVESQGQGRMTALAWAKHGGHIEVVELLLENEADLSLP